MQGIKIIARWNPETQSFYKKANAQKVAEEIYSLGENPQTEEILEMAKNENTEIHKLIEWDDAKAALGYRMEQVRHITRSLQITEIKVNANKRNPVKFTTGPLKMFHSLKGESGYRPITVIMQNEDLHKKLLMTARSELNLFVAKYSILTELEPVFKAIRDLDNPPAA